MAALPSRYLVYGRETGESGTPHLQGYIIFESTKRLSALKKIHQQAHWEIAKGNSQQASDYCKKDGDYVEQGVLSQQGKRTDLEKACDMIKEGQSLQTVAEECPSTFVKFGRGLRDFKLLMDKPYKPDGLRGEWYVGAPGTGKSLKARTDNPNAYLKNQNKWFDGYAGEKVIILDDLDTNALGHHLKIWSDRYPCTGETKGGTVNLQHDKIIVTSNYSIEALWPEDIEMQKAIRRRFKVTYFRNVLGKKET